ncbi:MAG: PEP-CTERM sorting domain-containing protein [Proteobacteria bacterium]|nr:PEP-CTERM sorting domain-containing protein [Pseudomonadota bacterium]
MYAFTRPNRLAAFCAPLALIGAFAAAPAGAALQETVQITNQFGTTFDAVDPTLKTGGSKETHYLGNYPTGSASELGLNYTATADQNGFFFLHDNYCVGSCRTASSTVIGFSVTNTGDGLVNTRFDSQITPGHLAKIYNGGGSAGFNFQVLKYNDGFSTLYEANGVVNSDGIQLNTGNLIFNNQQRQTGSNYDLLDWDTTNLSVNIGNIAGGQTVLVFYVVSYWSQTNDTCADVFVCGGNQVVFGDPRNNGGTNLTNFLGGLNAETGRAVIGADYGATFVPYAFVNSDDPFSFPEPQPGTPLVYDPLYKSRLNNVPEPATWAMMIGGFGLMGGALRRRRVTSVAFA